MYYMDKAENAKKLYDDQQERINTENKNLKVPADQVTNINNVKKDNQNLNPNKKKAIQNHKQSVQSK